MYVWIVSLSYTQTLHETSTWVREERKELTGLVLKNFQTSVSIESNGAMSARVTMEDCLLDDLRPTTVEEEEEEEEEEDEELQPESSVDAVDVGETFREQRISRYSIIIIAHWFSPLPSLPFFFPSFLPSHLFLWLPVGQMWRARKIPSLFMFLIPSPI